MQKTELHALAAVNVDVCVVGSGPIGASLAVELVERGLSVVVLESGLERRNPRIQSLSSAIIETPRFHEPMELGTCRALGGTSWLWGGRCTELEEIDFVARDYIAHSGWPFPYEELSSFYPRAAELLGIGSGVLRAQTTPSRLDDGGIQVDKVEIWANETRIHRRLRVFNAFHRIKFVLNATVIDIETSSQSRSISGLVVANEEQRLIFRGAKNYVLALGGVETARLLLSVQARDPRLFGGPDGALGRYYMGHLSGAIADISFSSPANAREFQFDDHQSSASRRRFTLSHALQQKLRVPNIAFWPDNPPVADATHQSGFLSGSYLLLSLPGLRSALIPDVIRRGELREPSSYMTHLRNCIYDFPGLVAGGVSFFNQRFLRGRRMPRWFNVNDSGTYRLHYHAEQRPSAGNRVSLSDERDHLGMRRAVIKFSFAEEEVDSVYEAHRALDRSLRGSGNGGLTLRVPRDQFFERPAACSADGLHQIGTTRMADRPSQGVVDPNCRVFEFDNLFIAGSSVFRTSGQANPTFPAIALALRLAAHLDELVKGRRYAPVFAPKPERLTILHVISSIDAASGGPSRAVFDLALAARVRGHDVTICATNYGGQSVDYADYLKAGVKVRIFPIKGPTILQYSPSLETYVRENVASFDIVHLHSLYLYHDWVVYRHAPRRGVPYILRPHGTFDPVIRERKRVRKWVMNRLFQERITTASAGIHYTSADELRLSNCSKQTSWVVPLPIRPEEFDGQDWDRDFASKYGVRPDFILFLGRLAWKKGADILIEAFGDFSRRFPDTDLVIAGPDDGEERKLRELCRKCDLPSKVHFTGLLDGPSRVAAYKMAKLFVLPSRGENFGRTVVEAMLVRTPILMTDRVGIWEQVAQADAAYIAHADVQSVLRGLIAIWESYSLARERAARARKLVESRFGIEAVGVQLEQMYREALALTHRTDDRRSARGGEATPSPP